MENAVDALKMAFAAFVFVIAIVLAFTAFSQAREVADIVLYTSDRTNYDEQIEGNADGDLRTVGIETVISSVKRYRIENEDYSVVIKDKNGDIMLKFDLTEDSDSGIPQDEQIEKLMNGLAKLQSLSDSASGNELRFTESFSTSRIKRNRMGIK